MTDNIIAEDFDWANEYIVLYEDKSVLIVLHRNIMRSEEFVMITGANSDKTEVKQIICSFNDYGDLLPYQFKIRNYQQAKDNFKLFEAFFKTGINEFFRCISALQPA